MVFLRFRPKGRGDVELDGNINIRYIQLFISKSTQQKYITNMGAVTDSIFSTFPLTSFHLIKNIFST